MKMYMAGFWHDDHNTITIPCYWINGTKYDLDIGSSTDGSAYSIAVSGGVVYAAGVYQDGSTYIPGYWVNGTKHDLDIGTGTDGWVLSIALK
ncbi:MAG: hypothetical protein LBG42_08390 [Treponema sp.]|nr:hypothetical protein [Treponema sp.]